MSIKKLCSIGILNINLNLNLQKSFAEKNNFNINDYNSIVDLKRLFIPKADEINSENSNTENNNIDYINYISLSSDDNLLNTLFYINRAYKVKTFIEYLIPNEIKYIRSKHFLKNLIDEILNRNYFFVVENNIINKSSKIKLIIKILDDENNGEIISKKEFNLVEETDNDDNENDIFDNQYFEAYKLNYDFSKSNYFFINIDSIKSLKWRTNEDLVLFILNIIKNNKIKIILSINEKSLINKAKQNKDIISQILTINKNIIEASDIIFCFKDSMNSFLKEYSNKNRTKIIKINDIIKYRARSPSYRQNKYFKCLYAKSDPNFKNNLQDLIIYDKGKYRKSIPRLSILLDEFDYLTIYNQEFEENDSTEINIEPYYENFCFTFLDKNHTLKDFKQNKKFLDKNTDKCFHIFIGGFLSRYINNANSIGNMNNYEECFIAGNLILKNYLNILKNNEDNYTDIDEYNVVVPKIKKCFKEILYEEKKEMLRNIRKKEQKFILDCINTSKSQKKEYNSLLDFNCQSFLSKKNNMNHLVKNNFININQIKPKNERSTSRKGYLLKNNIDRITNYYNSYNNMNKTGTISTHLIINQTRNVNKDNNVNNRRIIFKKFFDSKDNIKEDNNINKSSNKKGNLTLPEFLSNHKNYKNTEDMNKNHKNMHIKIPSLDLRKGNFNWKNGKILLSNNRNSERFDTSSNNFDKDYIKYLFKLYQPKKKFNAFLYNLSNLKSKK